MNIKTLKIQNFKLFANKAFSFDPNMNVIIGNNATGKTSILEVLSYTIGTVFLGFNGVKLRSLKNDEKRRIITDTGSIEVKLPFRIDVEHTLNEKIFKWYRDTHKKNGASTTYKNAKTMINYVKELDQNIRNNEIVNLPLIAYYGTDRVNDKQNVAHKQEGSRLDGYYASLDPEVVKKQFLIWFRDYEDSVLKFDKDKALYQAFTESITSMVKDWTQIHYSWKANDMLGKHDDGTWTSFSMMSAGYKNIIRITADIAYRAITLNPHLKENAVKETHGIVLIDEIDMHLHPKWQRTIIQDLKDTFPNIQFILTTHSPFIIQSLKSKELISLDVDNNTEEDPYRKSIPDIIEDEMNVDNVNRSKKFLKMQEVASNYFKLLQEGKTSKNDKKTKALKEQLDRLELEFNDDPVFVALMKAERGTEL